MKIQNTIPFEVEEEELIAEEHLKEMDEPLEAIELALEEIIRIRIDPRSE